MSDEQGTRYEENAWGPSEALVALLHRVRTTAGKSSFVLSDLAAMKLIEAYAAEARREAVAKRLIAEANERAEDDALRDAEIAEARRAERERCVRAIASIADEDMPEPYWDNARARRMDWASAVGRCKDAIRALPDDQANTIPDAKP